MTEARGAEIDGILRRADEGAAGAGIGALLGVAALAIPGVGPLAAAGAIAESAIGGAALVTFAWSQPGLLTVPAARWTRRIAGIALLLAAIVMFLRQFGIL